MRQHLGHLVGAARWAPLTTDGTFGPQVCPQQIAGRLCRNALIQG